MSHHIENRDQPNWPLLAALRFFLALIVLLQHLSTTFGQRHSIPDAGAWAAVCAFLVISGYSIHHSIAKEPKGYLNRRIIRVYPAYFVAFLTAFGSLYLAAQFNIWPAVAGVGEMPSILAIVSSAIMLPAFIPGMFAMGPAWTVSLEMSYYLAALWFVKQSRRTMWFLMAFCMAFFILSPSFGRKALGTGPAETFLGLLGFWLIGWQLYVARTEREKLLLVLLPCFAIGFQNKDLVHLSASTLAITMLTLTCGSVVKLTTHLKAVSSWLGEMSYCIYILHWPVLLVATALLPKLNAWSYIGVVLLASAVTHHLVERPYRAYSRRRVKTDSPILALSQA